MIFDLLPHILALVGTVIDQSLAKVEIKEIKVAQYAGCPISGETFAIVKFSIGNTRVGSVIGKYVGKSEDKFMKIYGSKGKIKLDILKNEFYVSNLQDRVERQGKLEPKHIESFLDRILEGDKPLLAPGVLSFDAAFEILLILDEVKKRAKKIAGYERSARLYDIISRCWTQSLLL